MDIVEIRRENLRRWVEEHGTPAKERSLFSQLKADASFGERVARRLEVDYRMGTGYLDQDPNVVATDAASGQQPQAVEDETRRRIGEEAGRLTGEYLALAMEMIETYRLASPVDRERIDGAFEDARSRITARNKVKPRAR